MIAATTVRMRLRRLLYFFPFRLVILHLKRNHLLLLFWFILFGYITGSLGTKYGIHYLFLAPEYMGKVNFSSFALLGFSCGGFIMAFNIYSYIMHGFKFPFIATVSRPFIKFCINNFIVPTIFILVYIYFTIRFQMDKEFIPLSDALFNVLGFLIGVFSFSIISVLYFYTTNRDLFKISGMAESEFEKKFNKNQANKAALHRQLKWYKAIHRDGSWHVETYMSGLFNIKLARDSKHYNPELLQKVFAQNHINAAFFEIAIVISFIIVGVFRDYPVFRIPAGASLFLLFTIVLMLLSALFSWFKRWTITFIIGLFLLINYTSSRYELLRFKSYAYGLDYTTKKANYNNEELKKINNNKFHYKDRFNNLGILDQWRNKNISKEDPKPKLIMICTSGGGLRSALWAFHSIQHVDSLMDGELLKHTQLVTGSSGGLIGASYLRELYLKHQLDKNFSYYGYQYKDNISKDVLNSVSVAIATNDIFIRYQKFKDGDKKYTKDRGYAFEKQLNENIGGLFDKRIGDYRRYEKNAIIPMLVFTPTIVNDGRRLLISSQPMSFLKNHIPVENWLDTTQQDTQFNPSALIENVEFSKLFGKQLADSLRLSSAIRMSATFPYIMPMVTLPSDPLIEVMDAGLRDNYGVKLAVQYLYSVREWIQENTSGVVLVQTRDRQKDFETDGEKNSSLIRRLVTPFGSMYGNFTTVQDYNSDQWLLSADAWLGAELDLVTFNLRHNKKTDDNISLSWHLTTKEKQQILNSIHSNENELEIKKLRKLVK